MKLFSALAHKVIGVSEGVTEEYLKIKLHLPENKVVLVNNGVALPRDISELKIKETKQKWGIAENDFLIGSTGRMLQDEHKRFSDLIKAFELFAKDKINVKLLLIGDGPEKKGYEKLAKELHIEEKVIFAGYQSDVSLFYKMMNVFSLVSAREAFGLVLAEAMLNKLPVVSTKVGGMKYIVDDEKTGFLVEKFNVTEIQEKFEILYNNRKLCKLMGEKGYNKALEEYTEAVYAKKIETLYLELFKSETL